MSNYLVTNKYKVDLGAAINELQRMEAEHFEMETRIAKQKKRVAALYELADADDEGSAPMGLVQGITDACRTVFRAADKPLYPIDVKNRVEALGLPPQQNLLASVHTVIKRLLIAKEVEAVHLGRVGPAAYRSTPFGRFKQAHDARYPRERTVPPVPDHVEDAMKETFKKK